MKYRFFKHTADTRFRAYGSNLSDAFSNAGLAFFEVMTDTKRVKPLVKKVFSKKSEDLKALLYDFLEELLFVHETEHLFLSSFKVIVDKKNFSLTCEAFGEVINESHERRALIKAVTYNDMLINDKFVQVVLDL